MAFFFKKKQQDEELPPMEELPPLPPLPGEDQFPPAMQRTPQQVSGPMEGLPPLPPLPAMPFRESRQQAVTSDKATVFVRVDRYRDIMQTIESMQVKVEELQATLDKIASIKEKEAEIIHGWGAMLQDAKGKIDEVNGKLQRPSEV